MIKRITLISLILVALLGGFLLPAVVRASPDTETLRPSAPGNLTELSIGGSSPAPTNWQSVDEAVADDDTTYVYNVGGGGSYQSDFYNLPASSGSGTINFITVYAVVKQTVTPDGILILKIRSNSTESQQAWTELTDSYVSYSHQWNTNPDDDEAWEWADIDALQIGYSINAYDGKPIRCTQVYVEIDYTLAPPTVTTQAADATTNSTAAGHGTITDVGFDNCDIRGFQWGASTGVYTANVTESDNYTAGAYTGSLTELPPKTTIYYRAEAHNSVGWGYGAELTFDTQGSPDVTTVAATYVKKLSARLNGNITDVNGKNADYRGFVWDTSEHGDPGDIAPADSGYSDNYSYSDSFEAGVFNHTPTLVADTTYYFRAYAHNDYGWEYGNELSFSTVGLVLWFQPNDIISGDVVTDRAGNNDGVITWGSNPPDVSANLSSFEPTSESEVTTFSLTDAYDILIADAAPVDRMFDDADYSKLPAEPINAMLDEAGVPRAAWWLPFIFLGICVIGFITYGATTMTRGPTGGLHEGQIDGSLLIMFIVMEAFLVALGKMGPIPLWPSYLFPIAGVALILSRKHFAWG